MQSPSEFDEYADDYEKALAKGISVSGESKEYFARARVEWLRQCLGEPPPSLGLILDYGCGTGTVPPYLLESLGPKRLLGVDVSGRSVDVARQEFGSERVAFETIAAPLPGESVDLAFCNGVFHHIPPSERPKALSYVYDSLKPGACFAFWENNPWNPGTQWVMARIPFDRDAVKISPTGAKRLLRAAGFEIERTDFLFVFPRFLKILRSLERIMTPLPLGAQYMVLARKPGRA